MAVAAFPLSIVIGFARMAREAEGAGRLKARHRGGHVALVALPVRIYRRCVSLDDRFGAVTGRAVETVGVVVVVTSGARRYGRRRIETDRGDVALGAGHVGMPGVLEPHLALTRRLPLDLNRHRDRSCCFDLLGLVASRAVAPGRALMVTDLAAAA